MSLSEDDVRRILFASRDDGRLRWFAELPHPRLWGAFPRVLGHYARDTALLPLEEADASVGATLRLERARRGESG